MEPNALTEVVLPAGLVLIMFGAGLDLRVADFARVLHRPTGALVGTAVQILIVPLVGLAIAFGLSVPRELGVGIVIISACPGGAVSNLISYLARADLALSVTLTAISSLITILTIPVIVNFALSWLMDGSRVELPLLWTSVRLTLLTLVPVLAGMAVRHYRQALADRSERIVRRTSVLLLAMVILLLIVEHLDEFSLYLRLLTLPLVLLNGATIGIGWMAAKAARLDRDQVVTLSIETGIQNGALGITIPALWIGSSVMAIPPALYGVLMLITGSVIIIVSPSRRARRSREPGNGNG